MPSPAELVADKLYREDADLTEGERRSLARTLMRRRHDWRFWARPQQLEPPGKHWQVWANVAGRGSGKLLDVDTPIPTPGGWARLGDLTPGDLVYDEAGAPTPVLAAYDDVPERAWRLVFSDGAELVAGGEHLWTTWTHRDRKAWNRKRNRSGPLPQDWPTWQATTRWGHPTGVGPAVRSTDDIVDTLAQGTRGDRNHSIPTTAPVNLPARALPVDPYVLGVWLGDGSSAAAEVTVHDDDAAHTLRRLALAGAPVTGPPRRVEGSAARTHPIGGRPLVRDPGTGRMVPNGSLHSRLRALGLLGDKHVPDAYLWASIGQRLRLLRGLMDSDGSAGHTNCVEFCNTNERLAQAVLHLARSLGERPVLSKGRAMLNGVDVGPKYRVTWRPARVMPFSLPRKAALIRPPRQQASRAYHRMIVAAHPVPVRPMRCLTVGSPNHLFLAGEAFIPTHNTRTGAEWVIDRSRQYHRAGVKHRGGLVGRTAADVRDTMVEGDSGIMACLDRRKIRAKYEPGRRRIVIKPLDTIIHTYSAMEPESLRGPQHHTLWCDEPGAWRQKVDAQGNTAWTNGLFGLRLDAPDLIPRVIATTTPKPVPLIKEWFDAVKPCRRPTGHKGPHGARKTGDNPSPPSLCGKIDHRVVMTTGALYDNIAHLAPAFVAQIVERYRHSPLGAQEIYGQLVLSVEGALWDMARIEASRVHSKPRLSRVIVAVDPPGESAAECGIIVLGLDNRARQVYVLDDWSLHGRGEQWGAQVIKAYRKYGADLVVAEKNMGGDMVRSVIHLQDRSIRYHGVTASVSKWERAEPVASAYSRVHHLDYLPDLEAQMCTWTDDEEWSPDRLDALVHGVRYLLPAIITPPAQSKSAADLTLPPMHSQRGGTFGG